MELNTHQKTFGELKRGDEIYLFCGGRVQQRMQVANITREGNRVYLKLKPPHINRYSTVCFVDYAPVEVFSHSYHEDLAVRYQQQVLAVLPPGVPCQTLQSIRLLIRERFGTAHAQGIRLCCERMAKEGKLVQKVSYKHAAFRQPLPQTPNLPVVELFGTKSQRAGWIVERVTTRSVTRPLVQWVDGTRSLSDEALLEPVAGNYFLQQQIRIAQVFAAGGVPEGFVAIPVHLIAELAQQVRLGQMQQPTILAIGEVLGLEHCWQSRNQILDYLDLYYPGWRRGVVGWQLSVSA